ncbi:outer membrane beta-barrel protein [Flavobacterium rakeshii]|uniref:Outer membrane beta-barrel protein n=1 Tax=Flavobacterium rakeshii TaxID=1038845 RepID=A0A6N8H967_9FLAO|nr:outer membrane beta-barrel protein [Flavobacterium rakeshii]MUV03159.1 outer membrane beta-barrel protein [Flavobacterium rakeshii]
MVRGKLFILLLLICTVSSFAQINISGNLIDSLNYPVEGATFFLVKKKDSTLITYGITDKNGKIYLKTNVIKDSVNLTFSLLGYEDKTISYPGIRENIELNKVIFKEESYILPEMVISKDVPIRLKNDTIEFNASSFKVREDANVEALLKELPGLEIDSERRITFNGKKVEQLLVNNKPFFNRDGSIAMENLPADLINKIQITDFKTKIEEFSGKKASGETLSINLSIDEDKNKGMFGQIIGGYGTGEHYESAELLNYFKGKQRLSILGAFNNINEKNFSLSNSLDNIVGASNYNRFFGSTESGITKTSMGGGNYSDRLFDKVETNVSYSINNNETKENSRSRVVNILPDEDFITESESRSYNKSLTNSANTEFDIEITPNTKLAINSSFYSGKTDSQSENKSRSLGENALLFNESSTVNSNTYESMNFTNTIQFYQKTDQEGSNFSLVLKNANNKNETLRRKYSQTIFYQNEQEDDIRNQKESNNGMRENYLIEASYSHYINEKTFIDVGNSLTYELNTSKLHTFDYDEDLDDFNTLNDELSNETSSKQFIYKPFSNLILQFKRFYLKFGGGVNLTNYKADAFYVSNTYSYSRSFLNPYVNLNMRYSSINSKYFYLNYNYLFNNPSATQVLEYERLQDPLNTIIGNSRLDQKKYHSLRLGVSGYNSQTRSGWDINLNGIYEDSGIVSSSTFDENRKRMSTYENVRGNYNLGIDFNWNKLKKIGEHNLKFGIRTRAGYSVNKGYTNGVLYNSKILEASPRVYLNWNYKDVLMVSPSYTLSYNNMINSGEFLIHNFAMQTTKYWGNFGWGNDVGSTYNTKNTGDFRKGVISWNTGFSYAFSRKEFLIKLKVYDVLNQNINVFRNVTPTYESEGENMTLRRYAMISLLWKFNNFHNKRESVKKKHKKIILFDKKK